jgi:hypothetical protein
MTASAPTSLAMQIADLVAVAGVLALILLLLAALADQSASDGVRGLRDLLEQPENGGEWLHTWRVGGSRPAPPRNLWLVQPTEVVVDSVPAQVQAEALEILDTLRTLDTLFPDHRPPTRNDEDT